MCFLCIKMCMCFVLFVLHWFVVSSAGFVSKADMTCRKSFSVEGEIVVTVSFYRRLQNSFHSYPCPSSSHVLRMFVIFID